MLKLAHFSQDELAWTVYELVRMSDKTFMKDLHVRMEGCDDWADSYGTGIDGYASPIILVSHTPTYGRL